MRVELPDVFNQSRSTEVQYDIISRKSLDSVSRFHLCFGDRKLSGYACRLDSAYPCHSDHIPPKVLLLKI